MATQNSLNFGTGTTGQVLTSTGAGLAPTFQTPAGGSGGQTLVTKVVAATGGDYTTLGAALTAASAGWVIYVKGTVTETAVITCALAVTIQGDGEASVVNLYSSAATAFTMTGQGYVVQGVTFNGGSANLTDNNTAWINFGGTLNLVWRNKFGAQSSTTTTLGNMVQISFYKSDFTDNTFLGTNNKGLALILMNSSSFEVRIANNKLEYTSNMAFIYGGPSTNQLVSTVISGNYGNMISNTATAAISVIDFYQENVAVSPKLLSINNNVINSVATNGIRFHGNGNQGSNTFDISSNKILNVLGLYASPNITVLNAAQGTINGNSCGKMTLNTMYTCSVNDNLINQGLYVGQGQYCVVSNNNAGINESQHYSGIFSGNIACGNAYHSFLSGTSNVIIGNVSTLTAAVTITETNSIVAFNSFNNSLTITGTGVADFGNVFPVGWPLMNNSNSSNLTAPFPIMTGTPLITAGIIKKTVKKTAAYTFTVNDYSVLSNATAAVTYTLPVPSTTNANVEYVVQDITGAAATNTITIVCTAGNINGVVGTTGTTLTTNYGKKTFTTDGTNWFAV